METWQNLVNFTITLSLLSLSFQLYLSFLSTSLSLFLSLLHSFSFSLGEEFNNSEGERGENGARIIQNFVLRLQKNGSWNENEGAGFVVIQVKLGDVNVNDCPAGLLSPAGTKNCRIATVKIRRNRFSFHDPKVLLHSQGLN